MKKKSYLQHPGPEDQNKKKITIREDKTEVIKAE